MASPPPLETTMVAATSVLPERVTVKAAEPAASETLAWSALTLHRACSLSVSSTATLVWLPRVPALAVLMETLKLSLGSGALSSVSAMETVFWVSPAAKVRVWLTPV